MEDKSLFSDSNRVSGIVAALIPGDDVEIVRDDVDDLSFTFVAPLGAHDCDVLFVFHVLVLWHLWAGETLDGCLSWSVSVGFEIVAARLFEFFQIFWDEREDPALGEMFAVDRAVVLAFGFFQERAPQEDLAAGTATCAFTLPLSEKLFVVQRVDVRTEVAADLALQLEGSEAQFFAGGPAHRRIEDW